MIFLIGLGIFILIITIHELGHFFVGKLFDIKFSTFSIGMGPRLIQKRFGSTVYCLSVLPIGGYVRSNAHKECDETNIPLFLQKTVGFLAPISKEEEALISEFKNDKFKIEDTRPAAFISYILGGCAFNFISWILAAFIFLYFFKPFYFFKNPRAEIASISESSFAYKSGFREKDVIIRVNGENAPFWGNVFSILNKSTNESNEFQIKRFVNNSPTIINLPRKKRINPKSVTYKDFSNYYTNFFNVKTYRYALTVNDSIMGCYYLVFDFIFDSIKSLVGTNAKMQSVKNTNASDFEEGLKKLDPLSSPIKALIDFGYIASKSIENVYFMFVTITLVAIVMNLLPIPGTDGFQIIVYILERWFKVNITSDFKLRLSYFGLTLFIFFMGFTTFRDLIKTWL